MSTRESVGAEASEDGKGPSICVEVQKGRHSLNKLVRN